MVRIQVYVDDDTARAIDAARGLATRSTWSKDAILTKLGGRTAEPVAVPVLVKRRPPRLRGTGGARV